MPRLVLDIADFPILLSMPSAELASQARRRYRAFLGRRRARLRIALALRPAGRPGRLGDPVVREGLAGRLRVARGEDFSVDLAPAGAGAGWARADVYSLDNLLRVAVAASLLRRGGLLLHAAGIQVGRRAWVFPGRSGRGKSTLSALAGRGRVLSDELTAVAPLSTQARRRAGPLESVQGPMSKVGARDESCDLGPWTPDLGPWTPDLGLPARQRWVAMATPFWGAFGQGRLNGSAPLAGLAFLRRSRVARCKPISADAAARRLLKVAMFFEAGVDGHRRLLGNIASLVRSVPTVELAFDKRRGFREVAGMLGKATGV